MNLKTHIAPLLLIVITLFSTACTNMFFYPMKEHVLSPDKIGLSYENQTINTDDGHQLHGWFLPAKSVASGTTQKSAKATIIFLHGNAENISTHIGAVYWLPKQGFNVFLYDYRGYGKSEGGLSIDTAISDVAYIIDYVAARKDVDSDKIIVFGQSLGAAIAANAVAQNQTTHDIAALVMESGFSDFRKIAREKLGESWLTWAFQWPLSLTITNKYSPKNALSKLTNIPILLIHGENDKIIPVKHAETLYQAASQPKELWIIPNGKHTDATTRKKYRIKLVKYFEAVTADSRFKVAS